jgi:hypothetical protein
MSCIILVQLKKIASKIATKCMQPNKFLYVCQCVSKKCLFSLLFTTTRVDEIPDLSLLTSVAKAASLFKVDKPGFLALHKPGIMNKNSELMRKNVKEEQYTAVVLAPTKHMTED